MTCRASFTGPYAASEVVCEQHILMLMRAKHNTPRRGWRVAGHDVGALWWSAMVAPGATLSSIASAVRALLNRERPRPSRFPLARM